MIFRDIAIHFDGFFGKHDLERVKAKEINITTVKVERSFLSYLPKKFKIAELGKLNINFGPKDPREKDYWEFEGIGNLNKGVVVTPDEILAMNKEDRANWALEIIINELCLLSNTEEKKEIIKQAAKQAKNSGFAIK